MGVEGLKGLPDDALHILSRSYTIILSRVYTRVTRITPRDTRDARDTH